MVGGEVVFFVAASARIGVGNAAGRRRRGRDERLVAIVRARGWRGGARWLTGGRWIVIVFRGAWRCPYDLKESIDTKSWY